MSNFSNFFPTAGGGGGGFTNYAKWSTARATNDCTYKTAGSYTVNPATDLGLEDGSKIYYFLVGAGTCSSSTQGTLGSPGKILLGITSITTASTDLTLTIGVGNNTYAAGTESTISGGLTLTSGNGTGIYGFRNSNFNNNYSNQFGLGLNGYGMGGGKYSGSYLLGGPIAASHHSFGLGGGRRTNGSYPPQTSGDGCIILMW